MINADFHTHTRYSTDSTAEPEDMLKEAIARGLKTYCFTDHMDYLFPTGEEQFVFDTDAYFRELTALRKKYRGSIDVRIGIELGLRNEPDVRDEVRRKIDAVLSRYPFDFVIGSTHIAEHLDPYEPVYWETYGVREGIRLYFLSELYSVRNYCGFQTYGHLDYVLRYMPKGSAVNLEEYRGLIDEILLELIARGIALEVNTSNLAKGGAETNPGRTILRRYRELGGELITLGSDAHMPERIATHFPETAAALKELGFKSYAVFRKQKASLRRL